MSSERSNAAFQWPKLDLNTKNFRLLRFVLSKCKRKTIHCELETASQAELKGHYIACSYVWGSDNPTETIVVNGKPFTIRRNLFDFLSSLITQGNGNKRFWVDAICIRQASHIERQHQVSIMYNIFADATAVYSWLGPSDSKSRLFDSLNDWFFLIDQDEEEANSPEDSDPQLMGSLVAKNRRFEEIKNIKTWNELDSLSRSAYWSRIWICAEFIVNPHVRIFWGSSSVEYDKFRTYFDCFESIFANHPELPNAFRSMIKTRNERHSRWENHGNPQTLEHYFDIFGHKSCQRLHDKIFALLSLVGDADHQLRKTSIIDYELSPQELLRRLLVSCHMDNPIRFIKNFLTAFELSARLSMSDHVTTVKAPIRTQKVSLQLSEYLQDFHFSGFEQVQNNTTRPLRELKLSFGEHHSDTCEVVTAFVEEGHALDNLCLFRAGRIDDFRFQHHVLLITCTEHCGSTNSQARVIIGFGVHSVIIDKGESDCLEDMALRKLLRKVALEILRSHVSWRTLAASLRSFSEASWICKQYSPGWTSRYRLETGYLQFLSLAAEIPGDLEP